MFCTPTRELSKRLPKTLSNVSLYNRTSSKERRKKCCDEIQSAVMDRVKNYETLRTKSQHLCNLKSAFTPAEATMVQMTPAATAQATNT